ncbi:hypothetical protein K4S27_06310 [Staphylococcus epidermidis]|nr:hypothetical protein [Staphylococcus epidermidis]MCG2359253.1 hypothetical protein [Staphylococcus epidermidis]MCG2366266.1 hypothetical protein [Staphylococcus epidermidis]MCG2370727.1 hypothetical protein [Staphylococcus epidermidis]
MKFLYKTTLLITMAVVTWKVMKIEERLTSEFLADIVNYQNSKKAGISLDFH